MNISNIGKICVVGWGRSGIALCNLLLSLGKEAKVSESRQRSCFSESLIKEFERKGVDFEFSDNTSDFIKGSQLLVLSPGVDTARSKIVKVACKLGIPVVGEIEFASWFNKAKIVAITGTNGKTTTAHLTQQVLKQTKRKVFLGGNIGVPFSSFVLDTNEKDIIVLEVSSFQLETIIEFRPYVAALLNIEADHLDRYDALDAYINAKLNIFKNQGPGDWALLNKNINLAQRSITKIKSQVVRFSDEFSDENFSCIYRIAKIFGLSKISCLRVFSEFGGIEHRMQIVRKKDGVIFINDSKATNPSSTIWALKNTKSSVILLAGGKDKGLDYSAINPYLQRVKKINLFGQASGKIKDCLNSDVELEVFSSMDEAVRSASGEAKPGDTVLLSPMCASFDAFGNYEERGNKFIDIVNNI